MSDFQSSIANAIHINSSSGFSTHIVRLSSQRNLGEKSENLNRKGNKRAQFWVKFVGQSMSKSRQVRGNQKPDLESFCHGRLRLTIKLLIVLVNF